jgi:transposase-like protein
MGPPYSSEPSRRRRIGRVNDNRAEKLKVLMKSYPDERKEAVLAKMAGPQRKSIPEIAEEENISQATLYNWRKEARIQGRLLPDTDDAPEGWTAATKFNAVLETVPLSEAELAEYCRKQGLYPEQLQRWRKACEQANAWELSQTEELTRQRKSDRDRIKKLEKELLRKDRALAETAAVLALSKKAEAIWGDEGA